MTVFTNLFTNPRPGASSGGWGAGTGLGGTSASSTIAGAGGPAGDSARRVTWSVAPTNFGGLIFAANSTAPVAVTAGTVCSAAGWTRPSKNQQFTARVTFFADSTYTTTVSAVDSSPIFAPANVWTEIKIENLTVPATANNARFAVAQHASGTLWAAGDTHDVQAATIVAASSLPKPFHGGMTSDATYSYAWTGTADASTSTLDASLLAPTNFSAVPVSGTEVDLSWTAAAGAAAYDLERDGVVIATAFAFTNYADTGLAVGATYSYRVRSVG